MKRRNSITHAASVVAALHSMGSGESKSKRVAAEKTGISVAALSPHNLANTARNPLVRSLVRTDPLDITAEVDGKRVSMREALSHGAESSVRTLARLAKKNGELSKAESEQIRQCKIWLDLCRNMGMFRETDAAILPSELAAHRSEDGGPDEGSLEWYLLDSSRHAQPPGMLRVIPEPAPEILQPEPVAESGKVEPKTFPARALYALKK